MLVEVRVQVDLNGRSLETRSLSHWVGVHGVYVVVGIVHHDHLGVSSLSSGSNISPDMFGGDLAVVGHKVIFEACPIIIVGFPDHSFHFGMSVSIMPVGIIVDFELSGSIFNESVSIVDT